jgi:hypothetical protein
MFIAALFTIAKLWKHPRCPDTDEWIKKMLYLYKWRFTQTQRRTKFCHSQGNRWKWRTFLELARLRRPKAACFLSFAEYRPNTNVAIL